MARKSFTNSTILQLGGDKFSPGPFVSQLVGPLPVFVFSYSADHDTLLHWSSNARQVLGINEAALIGPGNFLLREVHLDDRFHALEAFEKACNDESPLVCSYRWVRPDTRELRTLLCLAGWRRYKLPQTPGTELRALEGLVVDLVHALPSLQQIVLSSSDQDSHERVHEVALARGVLQHLETNFTTLKTLVEQIPHVSNSKRRLSELTQSIERSCDSASAVLHKLTHRKEPASRVQVPVDLSATVLDCLNKYSEEEYEDTRVTFVPSSVSSVLANPRRLTHAISQLLGCFEHFIAAKSCGHLNVRLGELQAAEDSKTAQFPGNWVTLCITLDTPKDRIESTVAQLSLEHLLQIRAREAVQILESCGAKLQHSSEPNIMLVIHFPVFNAEREEVIAHNAVLKTLDPTIGVLIVERDELVAKTLVAGLHEVGYRSAAFESYPEALKFAYQHSTELKLVIFEYSSGAEEFLRELRSKNANIKCIVVLPGNTSSNYRAESGIYERLGCHASLSKPFNLLELKDILLNVHDIEQNTSKAAVAGIA